MGGTGVELVVQPHQHGGGLFPGGAPVGGEGPAAHAADDPQVVGQGDEALVDGHVGEGGGVGVRRPRQRGVAQAAHEHGGHLLPGNVFGGTEGAAGGGEGTVGPGGLHGGVEPALRRHVAVAGPGGGHRLPAEQPHQGGDEGRPGDGLAPAEPVAAHSLEEAQLCGPQDALLAPVAAGDVAVAGGGRRRGEAQAQAQNQGQGQKFMLHRCVTSSFVKWRFAAGIVADFPPFVKSAPAFRPNRRKTWEFHLYGPGFLCYNNMVILE